MKSYFEDREGDWVIRFNEQGRTVSSTLLGVGQKNKLTYRLARNGSRPPASHDQRTQPTYLFGAVCPQNAEPVSPSRCLQLHLDEIATKVTPRGHAILILDQAC